MYNSRSKFYVRFEGVDSVECNVDVMSERHEALAFSYGGSNFDHDQPHNYYGPKIDDKKGHEFQAFSITKWQGLESLFLMKLIETGQPIAKVILECETPTMTTTYTLSQAAVIALSSGGSGGEDRLTENIVIGFSEMEIHSTDKSEEQKKSASIKLKQSC